MAKVIGLACGIALLLFPANPRNEQFSKYQRVEAYEVRPRVLMTARYSTNGQVCMVVLQKDHYVNGTAYLDSAMPHEEVTQIFDELVPARERGPLTTNKEFARLSAYSGNSVASRLDYENASLNISRQASSPGDIVAVIQWKHRACQ